MPTSSLLSPFGISPGSNFDFGIISRGKSNSEQQSRSSKPNEHLDTMSDFRLQSGSQLKVSEIVNPDGSITIRSLRIVEDGIWTKEEREIDSEQHEHHRQQNLSAAARAINSSQHIRTEISHDLDPRIKQANSLTSSYSHSEAIGHRLRRQRLARSPPFNPSINYSAKNPIRNRALHIEQRAIPPCYDGETLLATQSPQTFDRSIPKNSTSFSSTNFDTSSQIRNTLGNDATTSHKYVAFSEPLPCTQSQHRAISSLETTDIEDFIYLSDEKKRDMTNDIYNDLDQQGCYSTKQSLASENSDADSSIFDNVAQSSFIDRTRKRYKEISVRKNQNRITNVEDDEHINISNFCSVTVHKTSQKDKIGIFVHLENFPCGDRLVISKVARDGKFTNSRIEEGDIVVSINGEDMIEDPKPEKALSIVTSALDSVTFVVDKHFRANDSQSVTRTSISSISRDPSAIPCRKDIYPMTEKKDAFIGENPSRELNNKFFGANVVYNNMMKTERMTGDGSMLISKGSELFEPTYMKINESWKVSGVIVVSIENKLSGFEMPGLHMGVKDTSTGHVLYISNISPSSMFRKTPLRIGDIIISINSVSLYDNADIDDAYSALQKPGKRITVVAKKGEESLNKFLHNGTKQEYLLCGESPYKRRESINTSLTSKTSGTLGTSDSGEIARGIHHSKDDCKGSDSTKTDSKNGIKLSGYGESYTARLVDSTSDFESTEIEKNIYSNDLFEKLPKFTDSTSIRRTINSEVDKSFERFPFGTKAPSIVTITKNANEEDIGVEVVKVPTEHGLLLAVSKLNPCSVASSSYLKVGDVILAINGIDFKNDPNVARATSLFAEAQILCIEFHKWSSLSSAVRTDLQKALCQKLEEVKTKLDSKDANSSIRKSNKEICKSEENKFNQNSSSMKDSAFVEVGKHEYDSPSKISKLKEVGKALREPTVKKRQKVLVTVTKEYRGQNIGIKFAILKNKLVVTEVSPTGLLRNAPLAFGDTILSINGVCFRRKPDIGEAFAVIKSARTKVTLEILKAEYTHHQKFVVMRTKSCIPAIFFCNRREQIERIFHSEKL